MQVPPALRSDVPRMLSLDDMFKTAPGFPWDKCVCVRSFRCTSKRANPSCRYFFELPVALPNFIQVENTHFGALISVLIRNTAQMVGSESRTQLLLKFRFALHLLTFVNEDSRLLVLKLANIIAGLK